VVYVGASRRVLFALRTGAARTRPCGQAIRANRGSAVLRRAIQCGHRCTSRSRGGFTPTCTLHATSRAPDRAAGLPRRARMSNSIGLRRSAAPRVPRASRGISLATAARVLATSLQCVLAPEWLLPLANTHQQEHRSLKSASCTTRRCTRLRSCRERSRGVVAAPTHRCQVEHPRLQRRPH
jgi:hypothetical protein